MPDQKLARYRLVAQGLADRPFAAPHEAVAASGAMQGQDLPGAMASAALRTGSPSIDAVIADMDAGRLVRGYPMRGTVFLLAAADARWMGELCAGPPLRQARKRQHHLGLTDRSVDRARDVAMTALADVPDGLSRRELFALWEDDGQQAAGGPGYHLLSRFVSETRLFYGPWNGTDQNVVLADTWLAADTTLEGRFNGDRIAAVTELLRRYLASHGPATLRDFAWWTKLPIRDVRAAAPDAVAGLERDAVAGPAREPAAETSYWRPGLADETERLADAVAELRLLPGFDEFILGYRDRTFAMTDEEHAQLVPGNNGMFRKSLVIDGLVRGFWKRGGRPSGRTLDLDTFCRFTRRERALAEAAFGAFPFATS